MVSPLLLLRLRSMAAVPALAGRTGDCDQESGGGEVVAGMSARHRQVKRRIRELEQFADDAASALSAYERVIRDSAGLADLTLIRDRHRWWRDRYRDIVTEMQQERDLLATMPKSLGASPHDSGDEQQHRDRRKGERE